MPLDIAKIVTGNVKLLAQLSLAEVLEIHPLLDAQRFSFGKARKTKPIKVRPINTILDKSCLNVYESLLLNTLEATQPLTPGSMICWGEAGDVWQQAPAKLHQKYDAREVDADGFVIYTPKEGPDSVMNSYQIVADQHNLGGYGGFSVLNPWWGDTRFVEPEEGKALLSKHISVGDSLLTIIKPENDEAKKDPSRIGKMKICLHYGVAGDWTLQNQSDRHDVYRVKESFFNSTYTVEQKQG